MHSFGEALRDATRGGSGLAVSARNGLPLGDFSRIVLWLKTRGFQEVTVTEPMHGGPSALQPTVGEAQGVWKAFGETQALRDVSLDVRGW